VTLVSESFGRVLAHGGNAIGLRIVINPAQPNWVAEVVGIVPDVVTSVAVLEPLVMYTPIAHMNPSSSRIFSLRAEADPDAVRRELTLAIKQADPSIVPPPLLTLEDRIIQQMAPQQFGALVMGSLGLVAMLLTLLGTYVVAESMAATGPACLDHPGGNGAPRRNRIPPRPWNRLGGIEHSSHTALWR
jgi:hypothetical protein